LLGGLIEDFNDDVAPLIASRDFLVAYSCRSPSFVFLLPDTF
jgi:hypothetical protein